MPKTLAGFAIGSHGGADNAIQLDPTTRTGWTYGPGDAQIRQVAYWPRNSQAAVEAARLGRTSCLARGERDHEPGSAQRAGGIGQCDVAARARRRARGRPSPAPGWLSPGSVRRPASKTDLPQRAGRRGRRRPRTPQRRPGVVRTPP
ncbi:MULTISPECIES: hypothetical protein [unclassified Streptomyces]|uniref:hypothetical protein n=1 Tax=unclassified Streptomyces TaxID=2593676 RepID=UPI002F909A31|nr:hypothetical protein OG832_43800 [Streptomyces sp. NBC_00826]WTB60750.1 hypothetical protein OG832_48115 [Streptomyces sp. NBC_00826]